MIGPFIGIGFYNLFSDPSLKYQMVLHQNILLKVFYLLASVFLVFITSIACLPLDDPTDIQEKTLNLGKILFKRNILFLFILLAAASFSIGYIYPLLADHLYLTFGNS